MKGKFNGSEGEMISLAEARSMCNTYKSSGRFADNKQIKGFFFGKDKLNELLDQNGAMGIRIYYGIEVVKCAHQPKLVLVAADENGDDMKGENKVLDKGLPCPIWCPPTYAIDG